MTTSNGMTAVFLDPPYLSGDHAFNYAEGESNVAADVYKWCLENGDDPLLRIAFCSYEGNFDMPETWETLEWATLGGYANQGDGQGRVNAKRERIYFSPACLKVERAQLDMFDFMEDE